MANDLVVQLGAKLDQFASDMNQAGDIADSAVSRIENSFSSLNPGLGLSGLGGIATGAVAGVAALLTALQSVNSELADIAKNAEYAGVSVERFQQLQFAATQGGVSSAQATTDLKNVARLLADAKENENSLTKLLDTNNIKYTDRNDDVIGLNKLLSIAGDLINRFHSMPEKVEAAKALGLSEAWVQALKNGSKAFDDVANSADAAGAVIDKSTIAKAEAFDIAWKKSSAALSSQFKAVAGDIAGWLDGLIDKAADFVTALAKSNGATGTGQDRFNAIADALDVARKDAQGLNQDFDQVNRVLERYKQLIGADPGIIAGLEDVRAKAKAIADEAERAAKAVSASNFPNGVPLPGARPAAADEASDTDAKLAHRKTDADNKDAFDRSVEQSNRRIALLNSETATIGQNTEARERAKIVAELEEAAKRANAQAGQELYGITEATNPKIGEQADKMLAAAKAAREQQTSFQGLNEAIRFGGNELVNVLDQASQKGANFGQIMDSVLRNVTKQLLQAAITGEGAFAKLFGFSSANGGVGGLGGLISSVFTGGEPNPGTGANPLPGLSAEDYAPGYASGTDSAPGGMAWVGENGKELMNVPKGAQIIPNDVLRKGGSGDVTVNLIEDSSRAGQTQKTDNSNGGFDLTMFVDAITAKNAGNPGSATSAALNQRGRIASR